MLREAARSDLGWSGLRWSEGVEAAAGNVRVGRRLNSRSIILRYGKVLVKERV